MHSSVVINLGGIFWSSLADRPVSPENDNTYLWFLVFTGQICPNLSTIHFTHSLAYILYIIRPKSYDDLVIWTINAIYLATLYTKNSWSSRWPELRAELVDACPHFSMLYAPICQFTKFTGQRGRSKNHNKTKTTYCKLEGGIIWIECDWRNLIFSKN